MLYFIDPDSRKNARIFHIYLETEMSIKWVATVVDSRTALWFVEQLNIHNGNMIANVKVPSPEDEDIT